MTIIEPNSDRDLVLLEQIENDPDVTQASLAAKLGVAVGTVNWHLKRLVSKGYVKVKRAQRRKLKLHHHARRSCFPRSSNSSLHRNFHAPLSQYSRTRDGTARRG
jgi:Mn-dependent DtxR family transcriptional regulator